MSETNEMNETETLRKKCNWCPSSMTVTLRTEAVNRWAEGENIQDAMPEVSVDVKEMLISGTCPRCWEEMIADHQGDEKNSEPSEEGESDE